MAEKEEERTNVTGSVVRVLTRKDKKNVISDFKTFIYRSSDMEHIPSFVPRYDGHSEFKVCGVGLPETEGVPVKLFGRWVTNKYGTEFKADAYELLNPTTKSGIVKLFSGPMFPGIGKTTAQKMSERFGLDTFDIIEKNPRLLAEVLTVNQIATLLGNYGKVQSYGRLVEFLAPFGLSTAQCVRIHDVFGEDAVGMIQNDPYCLETIKGIGFHTCEKIATQMNTGLDSKHRIEGCLSETIMKLCESGDTSLGGGHMYVSGASLYMRAMKELNANPSAMKVRNDRFVEVLKDMIQQGKIVKRFEDDYYPQVHEKAEYSVAQNLIRLLKNPIDSSNTEKCMRVLKRYCEENDVHLHESQEEAVVRSLSNRVSIITGGPGTGKTTIISAILACYEAVYGDEILLMAPTGKAARRMSESTHREAKTIHSRLHIYGDITDDMELNPIDGGLVVVDECSMVDNLLMEKLMDAIENDDTQIIFVGDIDQLPSVGVGSVLGEMINSNVIPTSRLTKTFRQKNGGGTIIEDAKKINTGQNDLEWDDTFQFIEAKSDADAADAIMRLYRKEVETYGIENVALLCPLRSNQSGRIITCSDTMNERIQAVVNPDAIEKKSARLHRKTFRVGDRVMQWQNTKESANGDIGEILDIAEAVTGGVKITVKWESGNVSELNNSDMESISLAYAMSIHKSQGSEYQSVIIPMINEQFCPLFKRNLLYTGVTRAKKKVIIVGDKKAIDKTIALTDTNIRNSHLADRLIANAKTKTHGFNVI